MQHQLSLVDRGRGPAALGHRHPVGLGCGRMRRLGGVGPQGKLDDEQQEQHRQRDDEHRLDNRRTPVIVLATNPAAPADLTDPAHPRLRDHNLPARSGLQPGGIGSQAPNGHARGPRTLLRPFDRYPRLIEFAFEVTLVTMIMPTAMASAAKTAVKMTVSTTVPASSMPPEAPTRARR